MATASRLPLAAVAVAAVAAVRGEALSHGEGAVLAAVLAAALASWVALTRHPLAADEWLLLAAMGWAGVAAVAGDSALLDAKQTTTAWLAAALIWVCCRRASAAAVRSGLWVLAAAAVGVACLVVLEGLGLGAPRAGGSFANPNLAAAFLMPLLPVLWTRAVAADGAARGLWTAASLILALGVAYTGSRAALVAAVLAAACGMPRRRWRNPVLAAVVAVAVVVGAWRLHSWQEPFSWHRPVIWQSLLQLVAEHPVAGVGPGLLADATGPLRLAHPGRTARHLHRIGSAESTPLGLVVRAGLVGLAMVAATAWQWWRSVRGRSFVAAGGRRAALAAVLTMGLFQDFLEVAVVLWWWAALLGLLDAQAADESPVAASESDRLTAGGWLLATVTGGLLLWGLVQPALARHLWQAGPPSRALAERALRAEPWLTAPVEWRLAELLQRRRWGWLEAGEAITFARHAADVGRGRAALWGVVGRVNSRVVEELGAWPDAVASARLGYRRATELEPHLPWDWLHWATLERSLGQLEEAASLARRATTEEPAYLRAWLLLARVEADRGQPAAARSALDRALRLRDDWRWRAPQTRYEHELLDAPAWQLHQLSAELR